MILTYFINIFSNSWVLQEMEELSSRRRTHTLSWESSMPGKESMNQPMK